MDIWFGWGPMLWDKIWKGFYIFNTICECHSSYVSYAYIVIIHCRIHCIAYILSCVLVCKSDEKGIMDAIYDIRPISVILSEQITLVCVMSL